MLNCFLGDVSASLVNEFSFYFQNLENTDISLPRSYSKSVVIRTWVRIVKCPVPLLTVKSILKKLEILERWHTAVIRFMLNCFLGDIQQVWSMNLVITSKILKTLISRLPGRTRNQL